MHVVRTGNKHKCLNSFYIEEMTSQRNSCTILFFTRVNLIPTTDLSDPMCISIECITTNKQGGVQVLYDTGAPCILQAIEERIINL